MTDAQKAAAKLGPAHHPVHIVATMHTKIACACGETYPTWPALYRHIGDHYVAVIEPITADKFADYIADTLPDTEAADLARSLATLIHEENDAHGDARPP